MQMSYILGEKWIWIIIGCCIIIMVGPYIIFWLIFQLPEGLRSVFVMTIIVLWGISAGYKDWLMDSKKRREKGFPE